MLAPKHHMLANYWRIY